MRIVFKTNYKYSSDYKQSSSKYYKNFLLEKFFRNITLTLKNYDLKQLIMCKYLYKISLCHIFRCALPKPI